MSPHCSPQKTSCFKVWGDSSVHKRLPTKELITDFDRGEPSSGFANLLGSVVALTLMHKLGRKLLLMESFPGMAASMGLQATAASFPDSWSLYLSVGGILLSVLAFALGAGPVPGLLLGEMFPNRIRAKAMAICVCVHWVVNFFVGLLFLPLLEQLGSQILYSIFASFCLIAAIFVRRNVVETKGKTLQEIDLTSPT